MVERGEDLEVVWSERDKGMREGRAERLRGGMRWERGRKWGGDVWINEARTLVNINIRIIFIYFA